MRFLLIVLALLLAPAGRAAAADCTGGLATTVPVARLEALRRGFNLPGWLDTTEHRHPDPALLRELRALGFTHVRLPVRGELVMPAFSGAAVVADTLAALDAALGELIALGYVVSVDLHPGAALPALQQADPAAGFAALADGWARLAVVVARHPADAVLVELLNEPVIGAAEWAGQSERLVALLRPLLPDTTIVIGPAVFQRIDALEGVRPVADGNVVYAVHFYDPLAFTHQGLTWADGDPLSAVAGVPFPTGPDDPALAAEIARLDAAGRTDAADMLREAFAAPWDAAAVRAWFDRAGRWSRETGRPVIVNEFGVLRFAADPASRMRWLRAVVAAAEINCIGWTHWDLQDGFGIVDPATGGIDPAVVSGLLGASTE